jgi:16S rRNA (cytidine1402-2'-O)-methyltransferase
MLSNKEDSLKIQQRKTHFMGLGTLYLIPVPLAIDQVQTIPEAVRLQACKLRYYYVEQIRTARRFLKAFDKAVAIDAIAFEEINKQTQTNTHQLKQWLQAGYDVGVMSEAGCPGVADPGSELVAVAQELGATVVPYVGPSSILLSLMASGFNGQSFRFVGYIPVKDPQRTKTIKELERLAQVNSETQIFIETPYRNNALLEELIKHCHPNKTKLCIAADITAPEQFIQTKTMAQWAKAKPDLHKRPTIFLMHGA